jgi:C1A family cysteine protease
MGTLLKDRVLNWKPQMPDIRDLAFRTKFAVAPLPAESDVIRPKSPPCYDQLNLGACTGNGIAFLHHWDQIVQGLPVFMPARLMIYFDERKKEHTISTDSGAIIRDGMKVIVKDGVCPESMWPYDVSKFTLQPTKECYAIGAKHKAKSYSTLAQTAYQLKASLAAGIPYTFGFPVYTSFMNQDVAKTGIMPMPQPGDSLEGGHCVDAVGYCIINNRNYYIVRNSWGTDWGINGYFFMPVQYMEERELASDFSILKQVA